MLHGEILCLLMPSPSVSMILMASVNSVNSIVDTNEHEMILAAAAAD